jgi:hypothetical protein
VTLFSGVDRPVGWLILRYMMARGNGFRAADYPAGLGAASSHIWPVHLFTLLFVPLSLGCWKPTAEVPDGAFGCLLRSP